MTKRIKWYLLGTCSLILLAFTLVGIYISSSQLFTTSFFIRTAKYLGYELRGVPNNSSSYFQSEEIAESVPVLLYHGIPDTTDDKANVPTAVMEDQLFSLKQAGYTTVGMNELYKYLRGEITLPQKTVVITFDDGRIDSFNSVDPMLKALGYKAIMFVISRYSLVENESSYYLSRNQLKDMQHSGRWDIQAHSYDGHGTYLTNITTKDGHFFSHKIWLENEQRLETDEEFQQRVQTDMTKAKETIEKNLKIPVIGFAYPFGDFGQNLTNFALAKKIVMQDTSSIYKVAFYQNAPGQRFTSNYYDENKANDPVFFVKRFNMNGEINGAELLEMLQQSEAKKLPFDDDFTANKGWLATWGDIFITSNKLAISSKKDETGASAILDGSRNWKDYEVVADVNSPENNGVYTWVRYKDDDNNAACNFNNGFIHIEQTVNGVNKVIKGIRNTSIKVPNGNFTIGAKVVGRNVECSVNGETLISTQYLDPTLQVGGIGFKTWSNQTNKNTLEIKSVSVTNI